MAQVKAGDTIKVHYTGTLTEDGSKFDSSEGRPPLEFIVGQQMVIHGFDQGVIGMALGEKKTINIPCLEAYGPMNEQMIFEFERNQLPEELGEPEVGMQLHMMNQEGEGLPVEIIELRENTIVLNGNHPLAGKDLTFDIELVEINS